MKRPPERKASPCVRQVLVVVVKLFVRARDLSRLLFERKTWVCSRAQFECMKKTHVPHSSRSEGEKVRLGARFMQQICGIESFVLSESYTNGTKFTFAQDSLQDFSVVYDSQSTPRNFYAFLREQGPRREAGAAGMRAERRCWAASGLR